MHDLSETNSLPEDTAQSITQDTRPSLSPQAPTTAIQGRVAAPRDAAGAEVQTPRRRAQEQTARQTPRSQAPAPAAHAEAGAEAEARPALSEPSSVAAPREQISIRHNRAADGIGSVGYAGALKVASGFTPSKPCAEVVRDMATVLPAVQDIDFIIEDCTEITKSRLNHLPAGVPRLSDDEALATVMYSYDLGINSDPAMNGADNFYVELNETLRKRDPKSVQVLRPYLYYFFQALDKLPKIRGFVLRGIPASSLAMVQKKYTTGTEIYWSAFTSTTTDPRTAKQFAEGSGGIIFRLKVQDGSVIKAYSAIQREDEVLLKPNTKFVVMSESQLQAEGEFRGFYVVEMVEVAGKFIF